MAQSGDNFYVFLQELAITVGVLTAIGGVMAAFIRRLIHKGQSQQLLTDEIKLLKDDVVELKQTVKDLQAANTDINEKIQSNKDDIFDAILSIEKSLATIKGQLSR